MKARTERCAEFSTASCTWVCRLNVGSYIRMPAGVLCSNLNGMSHTTTTTAYAVIKASYSDSNRDLHVRHLHETI